MRPKGFKHSEETKRKIGIANSIALKGRKLSKETKKRMSESVKGKNHWNWKGGISPENVRIRHSLEYEVWRLEVYKRDKYICRLCGQYGKDLVAHHLKLFSEFPELRFSVDNGITLCRKCHGKIHNPDYWGRNKTNERTTKTS